jgi:hypothetical protein
MALWDKVKDELDRAGKVAQEAIDEGRIRLEQVRARQLADKAAQRLGYAYARAHGEGRGADDPELTRLRATLIEHEAEATRLEAELAVITRRAPRAGSTTTDSTTGDPATTGSTTTGSTTTDSTTTGAAGVSDFGGNSGASHRPDGTVDTGGAERATPTGDTPPASGAPPTERTEWNREHM